MGGDFLWGVAASGFQSEGSAPDSNWTRYIAQGKIRIAPPIDEAVQLGPCSVDLTLGMIITDRIAIGLDMAGYRTATGDVLVPAFIAMLLFWPMMIGVVNAAPELVPGAAQLGVGTESCHLRRLRHIAPGLQRGLGRGQADAPQVGERRDARMLDEQPRQVPG